MLLPEDQIGARLPARVVASRRLTPDNMDDVRELLVDIDDAAFDAEPGQSVGVLPPGATERGEPHLRLYSLAGLPRRLPDGSVRIRICVRRCTTVEAITGAEHRGVASHYLCDLRPGQELTLTGPYGLAFAVPPEPDANLVLIGAGTGIAPFRAYLRHLYGLVPAFRGRVRLLHGATSGLDLVYRNDLVDDFVHYYDSETFEAITALAADAERSQAIDWAGAVESRGEELLGMLDDPRTHVYLAGHESIRDELDTVFAELVGSRQDWLQRKQALADCGRWVELLY